MNQPAEWGNFFGYRERIDVDRRVSIIDLNSAAREDHVLGECLANRNGCGGSTLLLTVCAI